MFFKAFEILIYFLFFLIVMSIKNLFFILQNQYNYQAKYFPEWILNGTTTWIKLSFIVLAGFILGMIFAVIQYWRTKESRNELILSLLRSNYHLTFILYFIMTYILSKVYFLNWGKDYEVFVRILTSMTTLIILYMIAVFIQSILVIFISKNEISGKQGGQLPNENK